MGLAAEMMTNEWVDYQPTEGEMPISEGEILAIVRHQNDTMAKALQSNTEAAMAAKMIAEAAADESRKNHERLQQSIMEDRQLLREEIRSDRQALRSSIQELDSTLKMVIEEQAKTNALQEASNELQRRQVELVQAQTAASVQIEQHRIENDPETIRARADSDRQRALTAEQVERKRQVRTERAIALAKIGGLMTSGGGLAYLLQLLAEALAK